MDVLCTGPSVRERTAISRPRTVRRVGDIDEVVAQFGLATAGDERDIDAAFRQRDAGGERLHFARAQAGPFLGV